MRCRGRWLALLVSAALACACEKKGEPGQPSASARAVEGLCEHGVLAELCPKCEPSLAAVYQANGDLCAEHGMPESFCPSCHPEANGRPVEGPPTKKPASTGTKAPADGMKVRLLSTQIVEGAGFATVKAVKAPAKTSLRFPARVVYDATRTADVSASAGGVLRSVAVDLGASVKAGDTLATLDSAEVGGDRSKLSAAYRRVKARQDRVARTTKLEQEGVASRRDRVDAELALDEANADASSLAAELGVSGAANGRGSSYALKSPLDGIVTRRLATVGKLVDDREALFQIVDPSVLWAEIDVPEGAAASVALGAEVTLTFAALPAEAFAGRLSAILPEVDVHTRTVTARVSVDNPHLRLRANMFGDAAVLGDTPPEGVTVPRAAVQTVDRQRFVFVRKEPLMFAVRYVTVPSKDGEAALVTMGLEPGEEVVTTGSFLLKTETLKDSIGAGCCADD